MPIIIDNQLPAASKLESENIFVMFEERAETQDIRPLKIGILNLMPTKIETETQLLRRLSNTPLQIDVELIQMDDYIPKNTPPEHMTKFYKSFSQVKDKKFDGLIITGAPVEHMEFEEVEYWEQLKEVMEFTKTNVTSTMYICWAAQAGLYYHYGVGKYPLKAKMFGVFEHETLNFMEKIVSGFDEVFYAPHSRNTEVKKEEIQAIQELLLLVNSEEAGVYLVQSKDRKHIFVMGHSEYDRGTLDGEYRRDVSLGKPINVPCNYYKNNDPKNEISIKWRGHSNLLFANWINYYVYQETPYKLEEIHGSN